MTEIEVHVGTDFLIVCGCGFEERTKSSEQLESIVSEHEAKTGHHWPTFEEAAEAGEL